MANPYGLGTARCVAAYGVLVSSILRDKKGGPLLLVGAALALGGGILGLVHGAWIWTVLVAVGLVIEFSGPYVHDRAHRRHGEEPHAMWGKGDRNKPGWLRR
jgi:hypothetical protein